jgi:hypothetical protein
LAARTTQVVAVMTRISQRTLANQLQKLTKRRHRRRSIKMPSHLSKMSPRPRKDSKKLKRRKRKIKRQKLQT